MLFCQTGTALSSHLEDSAGRAGTGLMSAGSAGRSCCGSRTGHAPRAAEWPMRESAIPTLIAHPFLASLKGALPAVCCRGWGERRWGDGGTVPGKRLLRGDVQSQLSSRPPGQGRSTSQAAPAGGAAPCGAGEPAEPRQGAGTCLGPALKRVSVKCSPALSSTSAPRLPPRPFRLCCVVPVAGEGPRAFLPAGLNSNPWGGATCDVHGAQWLVGVAA